MKMVFLRKTFVNEILPALSCAGEASQLLDCACQGNYLLLWCLINTPVLHCTTKGL